MKKGVFVSFLILPFFILIILLFVLMSFVMVASTSGQGSNNTNLWNMELMGVNEAVLAYQPVIELYASKHDMSDYVYVIMAIMMQESGGHGTDPMQSSESKCGAIGCITTPDESIEQGIIHFKKVLEMADDDLLVAIQAYNFGTNFVHWIKERGGDYSLELATEYSKEMYQKEVSRGRGSLYSCAIGDAKRLGACYGDYLYVQHVMRYLSYEGTGENLGTGVWGNPLSIPMKVTSPFRPPHRPNHNGIDYSCNQQYIPIYAVDDGVVVESLYGVRGQGFGGYGNIVLIQHDSNLYSLYAHLDQRLVTKGMPVKKGQQIGTCGGTGDSGRHSYAIHLHLEARTSKMGGQVNPATFFVN